MGFDDVLKGYQPQTNDDGTGFDIIKGRYKTKINHLQKAYGKEDKNQTSPYYKLELQVTETIEGDKGGGRRFWKSYDCGNDDKMQALLNDLFTAGLDLPRSSKEDFESAFSLIKDSIVFVRAWGQPDNRKPGGGYYTKEEAANMELPSMQRFNIYNPAKVKPSKPAAEKVPF